MLRMFTMFQKAYKNVGFKQYTSVLHALEESLVAKYPNEVTKEMLRNLEATRQEQDFDMLLAKNQTKEFLKKYPNEVPREVLKDGLKRAAELRKYSSAY